VRGYSGVRFYHLGRTGEKLELLDIGVWPEMVDLGIGA
jgi:hypothetical protein